MRIKGEDQKILDRYKGQKKVETPPNSEKATELGKQEVIGTLWHFQNGMAHIWVVHLWIKNPGKT